MEEITCCPDLCCTARGQFLCVCLPTGEGRAKAECAVLEGGSALLRCPPSRALEGRLTSKRLHQPDAAHIFHLLSLGQFVSLRFALFLASLRTTLCLYSNWSEIVFLCPCWTSGSESPVAVKQGPVSEKIFTLCSDSVVALFPTLLCKGLLDGLISL